MKNSRRELWTDMTVVWYIFEHNQITPLTYVSPSHPKQVWDYLKQKVS